MRHLEPAHAIICGLGVLLAWAGMAPGVDSIVYYVFGIVDQIPNDPLSIIKPVYNPEPMYTHAYRPLSTAIVKLGGWLFGRDETGMIRHTFAHGLLIIPYGLGARRCLRAHGLSPRVSLAAALTAMLTPTVLFSAWTIPEFDMVGGAIILFGAAELRLGRLKAAIPLFLLAILTKETTAILGFAYLLAFAVLRHKEDRRGWWLAGGYLVLMLCAVLPILLVKPEVTHKFNLADADFEWIRIAFLSFHNASQVFYVLGPAGALLLLYAAFPRPLILSIGAGLMLLTSPLLRLYNHYESIIFSHWLWVLAWFGVATVGLFGVILRGSAIDAPEADKRDARTLALCCALGFGGLLLGPIMASFSRADLSSRLYAPLIPMLHGLCWAAVAHAWAVGGRWHWRRAATALLAACLAWLPVAGAVSAWQFTQARFPVERSGKQKLLQALEAPCPVWVVYTNRDQELAQEELDLLGHVEPALRDCTKLIQLAVTETGPEDFYNYPKRLEGHDQWREELRPEVTEHIEELLRMRKPLPHPLHLYVQAARSTMTPSASQQLDADFEWATRKMPETDLGYFQQTVGIVYVPDTPLERLFEDAAPHKARSRAAYIQLPLWLHELPRRLLTGVPLVETYDYKAVLYTIPHGVKPTGTPDRFFVPAPPRN